MDAGVASGLLQSATGTTQTFVLHVGQGLFLA